MSTRLWQLTLTAELDEDGDVTVDYAIDDTVSVAELIGHLEVLKLRIINDNNIFAEGEEEIDTTDE